MLYNTCNIIKLSNRKGGSKANVGRSTGGSNNIGFLALTTETTDFYAVRLLKEVSMKKILVVLALFLIPSLTFASASGTSASATLSSTFTVFAAIQIAQQQSMTFPTAIAGNNPSTWDTTMSSAAAGGAAGQNGIMRITSGGVGSASLSLAATTIATNYPITFAAVSPANTASINLSATTVDVTLKGTINASSTPFAAGAFGATTVCTVKYI